MTRDSLRAAYPPLTDEEFCLGWETYEATGGSTIYSPLDFVAAYVGNREAAAAAFGHIKGATT